MLFEKFKCERSTVRTQCEEKAADSWETVLGCLEELFDDSGEFVVFTLADSDIKHGIQYIQSSWTADGLTVQLGLVEDEGIRLLEKYVSPNECESIFRKFFETSDVENIKDYTEVEF